ncbi:MAG: YciC family protein [Solirubrobacterales bacterium]
MNSPITYVPQLNIGELFRRVGEIYRPAFGAFWLVLLSLFVPIAVLAGIGILVKGPVIIFLAYILFFLAALWFVGIVVKIVEDVEADGTLDSSVRELIGLVAPRIPSLILLAISTYALIYVGTLFLLIPGIIVALKMTVAVPALFVEEKRVFETMARSAELTRGNLWKILGVIVLIYLALLIFMLIVFALSEITPILGIVAAVVGLIAIYPYIAMVYAVLYFDLAALHGQAIAVGGGPGAGLEPATEPGSLGQGGVADPGATQQLQQERPEDPA